MPKEMNDLYISAKNITKKIDNNIILNDLSFEVKRGEIFGLLGPNGAGKSTTMKILVGSIIPTSGVAEICGCEVLRESQSAKEFIGYLPEHNPLYLEMYVLEYLYFVASLRNLDKEVFIPRVENLLMECGLESVRRKKIFTLSKGYRQRVGLAQVMIHDPKVLILDEPTTGLDPSQIVEIRELIKKISSHKAVVLSTHIMQEVEALCTNVLILKNGKSLLNESIEHLHTQGSNEIFVEFKQNISEKDLLSIDGVSGLRKQTIKGFFLLFEKEEIFVKENIFNFAKSNDYTILEMTRIDRSIEDIFKDLVRSN